VAEILFDLFLGGRFGNFFPKKEGNMHVTNLKKAFSLLCEFLTREKG
jgi:hypothetical protein